MDETQVKDRMEQVLELFRADIGSIRTGRATPSLVEDIIIDAYGGTSKLRVVELASITVPDPQTVLITPWDKSVVGEIRKGIERANIGINPVITSDAIRISLSPMTSEDREKYVKLLHQKLEGSRVMVRQARQDGMHDIRKAADSNDITEDQRVLQEKKLQETTDKYIERIEELGKAKEKELRTL